MEERVTLALRDWCNRLLMRDTDGVLTLDYLGAEAIQSLGGIDSVSEPIAGMKLFVKQMLHAFKGNPKILKKYEWVDSYIRSKTEI